MPVLALATANYSLLSIAASAGRDLTIGVLLEDLTGAQIHIRLRRDWTALVEDGTIAEEEAEIFELLEDDLRAKSYEFGAVRFFHWIEDSLSNLLRVTDRESVVVENFDRSLDRLYRQHVTPKVLPFRTHLPVYTLQAAAGRFLENQQIVEEGWEETPSDLRLADDLFIAHINGRSMEPKIPDGSLCVFRAGVVGSRQGKRLLIQQIGASETGGEFTVKRYHSQKVQTGEDEWQHASIRLEPINPEFEPMEFAPADEHRRFRVIGEFVEVLD